MAEVVDDKNTCAWRLVFVGLRGEPKFSEQSDAEPSQAEPLNRALKEPGPGKSRLLEVALAN